MDAIILHRRTAHPGSDSWRASHSRPDRHPHVRSGVVPICSAPLDPDEDDPGGYLAHRRMIDATLPQLQRRMPCCATAPPRCSTTYRSGDTPGSRPRHEGRQRRRAAPRPRARPPDATLRRRHHRHRRHAVTILARTVADLGRSAPTMETVAVGDGALRLGLEPEDLQHVLDRCIDGRGCGTRAGWPTSSMSAARAPANQRAEYGWSRTAFRQPELQREIFDDDGVFVARVDFAWEERRTVGEFDGADQVRALSEARPDE